MAFQNRIRNADRFLLPSLIGANAIKVSAIGACISGDSHVLTFFYKLVICTALTVLLAKPFLLTKSPVPFVLFYTVQCTYLMAIHAYFLLASNYLTLEQIPVLTWEVWNLAMRQVIPFDSQLLLSISDLPILCLYLFRRAKNHIHIDFWNTLWKPAALASAFILATIEGINIKTGKSLWDPNNSYEIESVIRRYGTLANSLVGILKYWDEKKWVANYDYGPLLTKPPASDARPNFILIQVESMGSNILRTIYEGKPVTPNLRRLAHDGIFHPFALCYHKGGGSSDAEFSNLNSVEPLDHFVSMKLRNFTYPNNLVRRLKELGYGAQAFHGNHREFYNRREAYHKMGFDHFYDMDGMGLKEKGWGAPDEDVFAFIWKQLQKETKPFFYYTITMSSHQPFYFHLQDSDMTLFKKVTDPVTRNYLSSMAYTDRILGEFLDKLRREGPANTYVILFGDHPSPLESESFPSSKTRYKGAHLEFVPIILLTPSGDKRLMLGTAASNLDIAPTILEASGGGFQIATRGQSLLEPLTPNRNLPLRSREYSSSELFKIASSISTPNSSILTFPPWKED